MPNVPIRIVINTSDFSSSEKDISILEVEIALESAVASALSELFDTVLVEEVKVTYNPHNNSSLTDLHTKCWLIYHRRFAELIEYTQTHDIRFSKQANLIITQLSHNSPAEIKIDAGIKDIAEALKIGIDAFIQSPLRYKAAKLENEAKALETTLKEQEAHLAREDKEQARTIEAQRAEIEIQTARLRVAQQQLELEQQRLTLQKAILEAEHQRINLAFETASKIVERLALNADEASKGMLVQVLLPQLLQLGSSNGLELILPSSQGNQDAEKAQH